jgi:hypothetical protein
MRTIKQVIEELVEKGIKPYGAESYFYDYTDNEESPLKTLFDEFFRFGQEYLDRDDLEFNIKPARLYYSTNIGLNALARKVNDYYLVEIYMGTIAWMENFYLAMEDKFKQDGLQQYQHISQLRGVTPGKFLLQLATIYYFYHEVGHLIQRSDQDTDYVEYLENECERDEIPTRHMRELDADWNSAYCMALHLKQFAEVESNGDYLVDSTILLEIAALGLAAIYMYFINRTDKNPVIYYKEKCHPHPSVRLSYMLVFVLDNLQANVLYPINKNRILKMTIMISEILLKNGEDNMIADYSKSLLKELKEVEDYIKKIMGDTENYACLCKHILKPESNRVQVAGN